MPRRAANDAAAAVEAAAEDLFGAGKSWARYLKEREQEPDDDPSDEATAIAGEIAKLGKSVSALAERLRAASSS